MIHGAGIYSEGDLTIKNAKVKDHLISTSISSDTPSGGGIYQLNGDLTILNSEISNNRVYNQGQSIITAAAGETQHEDPAFDITNYSHRNQLTRQFAMETQVRSRIGQVFGKHASVKLTLSDNYEDNPFDLAGV